jgi:shikimate dehydrogenase
MNAMSPLEAGALQASTQKLLLGLIGSGIQRSLTPAMQEQEASAQGLKAHYQLIDLEHTGSKPDVLPALIQAAQVMGFRGLNITYPCKQLVLPLLDDLSAEARAIGAVNTVVFDQGKRIGHNTDVSGWRSSFVKSLPDADLSRVVILGIGGAGSAIAHALLGMGTGVNSLVLYDIDTERANAMAARLNEQYKGQRVSAVSSVQVGLSGATGFVQCSPMGMDKLPGMPVPAALLHPKLWVSEIIYFPLETPLVKAARTAGCSVVDGGGMAVGQAVDAFELFTGLKADVSRMTAHFLSMVKVRAS